MAMLEGVRYIFSAIIFSAINDAIADGRGKGAVREGARILAYVTVTVDQERWGGTNTWPPKTAFLKAQLKGQLKSSRTPSEPCSARSVIAWVARPSPRSQL